MRTIRPSVLRVILLSLAFGALAFGGLVIGTRFARKDSGWEGCCTLAGESECDQWCSEFQDRCFDSTTRCAADGGSTWTETYIQGTASRFQEVNSIIGCSNDVNEEVVVNSIDTTVSHYFQRSDNDVVCTLYMIKDASSHIIPVARSYLGQDWEAYTSTENAPLIDCSNALTDDVCELLLPQLPTDYNFVLRAFSRSLSKEDEIARFLEQSTFGPTVAEIQDLQSSGDSFARWVKDQQDTVALTSHRQLFREYTNVRFTTTTAQGRTTLPCEEGSRYRRFALTSLDGSDSMEFEQQRLDRYILRVRGEIRTVILGTVAFQINGSFEPLATGSYRSCRGMQNYIGSTFYVRTASDVCRELYLNENTMGNPPVYFDSETPPPSPVLPLDAVAVAIDPEEVYLDGDLLDTRCDGVPILQYEYTPTVVGEFGGLYYLHDQRFALAENTLDSPAPDGGGALSQATGGYPSGNFIKCANTGKSFLNEDHCELSYETTTCGNGNDVDFSFYLNTTTLQILYDETVSQDEPRYAYVITGLSQGEGFGYYPSPCTTGSRSRWVRLEGPCSRRRQTERAHPDTEKALGEILEEEASGDTDADEISTLRDIIMPRSSSCDLSDQFRFDFVVPTDNDSVCWLNVHRDEWEIFDFTDWVPLHEGGSEAITKWAEVSQNRFVVPFPDFKTPDYWHNALATENRIDIGRLGKKVQWSDLPSEFATTAVAEALGVSQSDIDDLVGPRLVCGSPFEVANQPKLLGDRLEGALASFTTVARYGDYNSFEDQKRMVWMRIALEAPDQLRQRVAWALSQILVISPDSVGGSAEPWATYYDIFVRHAFGNYRDILREVSFSPQMGEMLTFANGRSTEHFFIARKRVQFADENFAREIMQLFTVGLFELNGDGSLALDQNGNKISTYQIEDVSEYARAWTGFQFRGTRGNVEATSGNRNRIDPMSISLSYRDHHPKMGMNGWYIGDGLPLCADLPDQHFLKVGATYRLLGSKPDPKLLNEPYEWTSDDRTIRLSLPPGSELFDVICQRVSGECTFPSRVTLDSNLRCTDIECAVESPRVIEVSRGIFYEYTRVPCANQAYYNGGKAMRARFTVTCPDPRMEDGGAGCCQPGSDAVVNDIEMFSGERLKYASLEAKCQSAQLEVCTDPIWLCTGACQNVLGYWSSAGCTLQVKLNPDGRVAIVHSAPFSIAPRWNIIAPPVRADTKTYFRVEWETPVDSLLSNYAQLCSDLGGSTNNIDELCIIDAAVEETPFFSSMPSVDEVLSKLHVGAFDPSFYDPALGLVDEQNGVSVYAAPGQPSFSTETVFAVVDSFGRRVFRKNVRSMVRIGIGNSSLRFRNPNFLYSFSNLNQRDAEYETEATLDHYFFHKNTAPFIAERMAQRFGFSNPSPRFVKVIATAFRDGFYRDASTGIEFGDSKYGNLASTVAAVLLDAEARSIVLDADPAHGSLLEPFLKLVRILRSLNFVPDDDRPFIRIGTNLQNAIGQEAHRLPNVFSFFLPEHTGPLAPSGLKCPECQVLTAPSSVNLMNGIFSLFEYGLDNVHGGFGYGRITSKLYREPFTSSRAEGALDVPVPESASASQVVDLLATLLTSGRLSTEKRELLTQVYQDESNALAGLLTVGELMVATPEFQTNGIARSLATLRAQPSTGDAAQNPYKAVVYYMLEGGYDSFNVLVPHECTGVNGDGVNIADQYMDVRGELAMSRSEFERRHQINVDERSSPQPCTQFAVHHELGIVKELYDSSELIFFANTGVLDKNTVTKQNFGFESTSKLFAHNTMRQEAQLVDPWDQVPNTGILGRLTEVLEKKSFVTNSLSIDQVTDSMASTAGTSAAAPQVLSNSGTKEFYERGDQDRVARIYDYVYALNNETEAFSNVFGEAWADQVVSGIRNSKVLKLALEKTSLGDHWEGSSRGHSKLKMIARAMQTRQDRGVDRDVFYAGHGSFDHHGSMKKLLRPKLRDFNEALSGFVQELKDRDLWESVTLVLVSDFGRTLSPNSSSGSDHAWGGNYFIFGGSVDGGRILGTYPSDLTGTSHLNVGKGRLLPTTSWDCVWNGVAEWMGASGAEELDFCLPNRNDVTGNGFTELFDASMLYK